MSDVFCIDKDGYPDGLN